MSSDFLLFYDGVIKLRVVRVPRIEFRMADRVLHLGRWKLIYTGRKEVKRRKKRRRRREVGKIVGSGEERETERERERKSHGIYDGGSAYVSTHYGVHGIKEAAFTTSHIPFTASEI